MTTNAEVKGPLARRSMGHLPLLDGLRGVAIAFVVGVHLYAPVFSGGSSGVDLFFVLSGFLITKLALEEHDRNGGFSLQQFYIRRVFRILPALFFMLAFLLVASFTFMSYERDTLQREIMLSGASIGNLWPIFYGFEARGALGHTWSLGIEEQFYLVWPFILVAIPLAFQRTRRFALWLAGSIVLGVVLTRVLIVGQLGYPHWKSIPVFDFDGLALGCLLAMVLHTDDEGRWVRVPRWLVAIAVTIITLDLFGARFYDAHDRYDLSSVVIRSSFLIVLSALLLAPPSRWSRPLLTAPMIGLGRLSYSLYLWHVPVFAMFATERFPGTSRLVLVPAKVAVAFLAALASYWLIEQPAIRYGRRLRARRRTSSEGSDLAMLSEPAQ